MVYGELKHIMWYMVNFEETQWYIMKYLWVYCKLYIVITPKVIFNKEGLFI